jgi:CO/xanthine dehydrogenase Mo-binding subunit
MSDARPTFIYPCEASVDEKGLGELTAVSVAPAIANAVSHATGKRIHDLPITIEKLLRDYEL